MIISKQIGVQTLDKVVVFNKGCLIHLIQKFDCTCRKSDRCFSSFSQIH